MSETVQKPSDNFLTSTHKWVTPLLLAILVAIFVVSLVVGGRKPAGAGEGFAGTDDAASQAADGESGCPPCMDTIAPVASAVRYAS